MGIRIEAAMGLIELFIGCVLLQIVTVSYAYNMDRNMMDFRYGELDKDFDPSWDNRSKLSATDARAMIKSNENKRMGKDELLDEIASEVRTRQIQQELRYLISQMEQMQRYEKMVEPERSIPSYRLAALRDALPKQQKRQSGSGAQICIWKVCPPSPWRRSSGK